MLSTVRFITAIAALTVLIGGMLISATGNKHSALNTFTDALAIAVSTSFTVIAIPFLTQPIL